MKILVDSSVWIDFFKNGNDKLQVFLNSGSVVINDIIFLELAPQLAFNKTHNVISLLRNQIPSPMMIDFAHLFEMRLSCLKNGINGVGIPDLMIAQYAIQNDFSLFSLDRHFYLMAKSLPIRMVE